MYTEAITPKEQVKTSVFFTSNAEKLCLLYNSIVYLHSSTGHEFPVNSKAVEDAHKNLLQMIAVEFKDRLTLKDGYITVEYDHTIDESEIEAIRNNIEIPSDQQNRDISLLITEKSFNNKSLCAIRPTYREMVWAANAVIYINENSFPFVYSQSVMYELIDSLVSCITALEFDSGDDEL